VPESPHSGSAICAQRLANQHLVKQTLGTASEVVRLFGAIQAQDYAGAKWGIAQRTTGATDAEIEQEIGAGQILRTHVLRPTWHFVSPADIRWMLALTAPRIRKAAAHHDRRLGIDDDVRKRSRTALSRALQHRSQRTRNELAEALTKAGIRADGTQRLAHLMIHAELDGLVCSGARRGKQFTYALLDQCVPPTKELTRDEALNALASRYINTRGPATEDDFAWWSGLTKADARIALASVDDLETRPIDGRNYWLPPRPAARGKSTARLLPNYDEYIVSYADREATHARVNPEAVGETFDFLGSYVIIIDGHIVGRWKRSVTKKAVVLMLHPLTRLNAAERDAIHQQAHRFAGFLEQPLQIETTQTEGSTTRVVV